MSTPIGHSFATFIRIIGTGPGRARSLNEPEAFEAARMIFDGTAEPMQIGAFLMLLRYRKETAQELAGFVRAVHASAALPEPIPRVDLDWPSYAAGGSRGAALFVLAALLTASAGVRVLMHGQAADERFAGQAAMALAGFGITPAASPEDAVYLLGRHAFAFLPLGAFHPGLQALLNLRGLLGLRSPANTVARLINPFRAPATISGVFHPGYRALQQETAMLLDARRIGIFKGGGGEAELNPSKPCELFVVEDQAVESEIWPAMFADPHHRAQDTPSPPSLAALWRGDWSDPHAVATVTGTAALALRLAGRAAGPTEARDLAHRLWRERDLARFSAVSGVGH